MHAPIPVRDRQDTPVRSKRHGARERANGAEGKRGKRNVGIDSVDGPIPDGHGEFAASGGEANPGMGGGWQGKRPPPFRSRQSQRRPLPAWSPEAKIRSSGEK